MASFREPPDDGETAATPRRASRPCDEATKFPVEKAFTKYYRESMPRLVTVLIAQGAPPETAIDCSQETMIAAYRRWTELDYPYAWCRRVATRELVRALRNSDSSLHETSELNGHPLVRCPNAFNELEVRHEFLQRIAKLPPRQRQIMALTYDGELPSEIAETLEMNPATVRSDLRHARETMRKSRSDGEWGEQ